MRVLGLIPARGGSKGVPRKNIRPLAGRPLLCYTAEVALAARRLGRVILSTDDEEIAEVGRRCGLDVPFMRPAELARDDTPSLPVVQHALSVLHDQGETFDAVCLLQPTTPFRTPEEIDGCIAQFEHTSADSVLTVREVPTEHNPYWIYLKSDDGYLRLSTGGVEPLFRRQALPPAYFRDGSVYVIRTAVVMEKNSLYGERVVGYHSTGERFANIDTPEDWARAEEIARALQPSL